MELKNYMENLVWQYLDEVLNAHPDACHCEHCRFDIAALTLNFLPPRYVVTAQGQTWTKVNQLNQQFYVDIVTALSNAITLVKSRPHHEQAQ